MRYPDALTILRPSGPDAYGNPGTSWESPEEIPARGFLAGDACYLPPTTDVRRGDRLRLGTDVYDVEGDPQPARSPSRTVLIVCSVKLRRT
ncbi:hypothetical protein AB0J27_20260 [Micromonospora chokoriensis]